VECGSRAGSSLTSARKQTSAAHAEPRDTSTFARQTDGQTDELSFSSSSTSVPLYITTRPLNVQFTSPRRTASAVDDRTCPTIADPTGTREHRNIGKLIGVCFSHRQRSERNATPKKSLPNMRNGCYVYGLRTDRRC